MTLKHHKRSVKCSRCDHKITISYNGEHEFYVRLPGGEYLCESCNDKIRDRDLEEKK